MAEPNDLVIVEADGSVRVPGRGADRRLRDRAGRYRLVVDATGLIVLRAEKSDGAAQPRVLMAGEIVSRTSILELVNIIASASWRGDMHIFGPDAHRVLSIDQAALKSATSTHPDDRLGQVLYRNGILSKQQLDEILAEVDPERRFGQIVVDKGSISQEQLFEQLQKQVEQIFFASLLIREGHYVFVQPDEGAEAPVHPVHLPVQALLMEGVQRIDEMALFRERIPHDELVPEVQPRVSVHSLEETAQTVLAWADGNRTIEDIARETGLGQFMTVKALYGLLQQNLVVLRPKKSVDSTAVRKVVSQFNDVLRDIFMAVATYGGVDQTRSTLEAWIVGSGYGPIFGEHVEEDGSIDPAVVARALADIKVDNPMEGLHQALHELAAFALFAATTSLPRDQELMLSRDVTTRLKRIRM
ncbi:DUF4388 domain-containing protein [Sandaracinus amylolyticus]|uniref:PatA-like N-terminal domain-containing protein n=1 Tax=Sandaracinus amylolyticus TaxID=927083 RepID=A0A0F6YIE3_9BACT|nr:DUF4388 domain-containing protein [Sandaracinus amylolyticus]AKF05838.1 hypothetical protein DB32_002987 [Sandaracinus amylolyticus]